MYHEVLQNTILSQPKRVFPLLLCCNKASNKVEAANQLRHSFVEGNQAMALLLFLFFYHLHLLLLFPNLAASKCPESFHCGHRFSLEFPFSQDPQCGIFRVRSCNDSGFPIFQIEKSWYHIIEKISTNKFKVLDFSLSDRLRDRKCFPFSNVSLPQNPSISFTISSNLTSLFTCYNQTPNHHIQQYFQNYHSFYNTDCGPSTVYYLNLTDSPVTEKSNIPLDCGKIELPIDYSKGNSSGLLELLSAEFALECNVSQACYECYHGGGQCVHNSRNEFRCKKAKGTFNIGFFSLFSFPFVFE